MNPRHMVRLKVAPHVLHMRQARVADLTRARVYTDVGVLGQALDGFFIFDKDVVDQTFLPDH